MHTSWVNMPTSWLTNNTNRRWDDFSPYIITSELFFLGKSLGNRIYPKADLFVSEDVIGLPHIVPRILSPRRTIRGQNRQNTVDIVRLMLNCYCRVMIIICPARSSCCPERGEGVAGQKQAAERDYLLFTTGLLPDVCASHCESWYGGWSGLRPTGLRRRCPSNQLPEKKFAVKAELKLHSAFGSESFVKVGPHLQKWCYFVEIIYGQTSNCKFKQCWNKCINLN